MLRCDLRVTRARAVDHPLELVELLSLDLGEARRDPLRGFRLLAFDLLAERLLALAQPLGDLVQCAPALDALRLELGVRVLNRLFDRTPELVAHPGNRGALLVALADDSLGIRRDPGLDLCDELAMSLAHERDLLRESLLNSVQVGRPLGEPSLHLLLRRAERRGELVAELCLARDHRAPPLLHQAALLVREDRRGVGAGERECALELGSTLGRLAVDQRAQASLRVGVVGVECSPALDQA